VPTDVGQPHKFVTAPWRLSSSSWKLSLPALFLFLIVFCWTPPHFWALALLLKRDYEAARIPMLPVVRGERETARQIVIYSFVLFAVTLLPFAWHAAGLLYLAAALLLGAAFLRLAWRLREATTPLRARALFRFSLLYLALFGSVVAFVAYLTLLGRIGADRAGYTGVAIPIVALALSTLFEDLSWDATMIGGIAMCAAGNVLVLRRSAAGADR